MNSVALRHSSGHLPRPRARFLVLSPLNTKIVLFLLHAEKGSLGAWMQHENSWLTWLKYNREMAIEVLRIYLGIALMIKGIRFMISPELAAEYQAMATFPFFEFLSIHVIAIVHIAGGFLLAIGLISRIAALIQVPILFGAVFFVHFQQGLFTKAQDLEFVILVLFLLLVFAVYGGGRLSVDYIIENRTPKTST